MNAPMWHPLWDLAGPGSAQPGAVVATSRVADQVDVFWIAPNGAVQVRSWYGNEWHPVWDLAGPGSAQPGAVVATSRVADQVDVFWIAPNGAVQVRSWYGNEWHPVWDLAGPGSAQPGAVVATSRVADQVDVFWIAPNGAVQIRSWYGNEWHPVWDLAGPGSAQPGAVVATSRVADQVDVFWIAPNGAVQIRSWYGNEWHPVWDLAGPGSAQPGAVVATSRVADQVDVFWIAPNGAVQIRSWFTPLPARLQFRLRYFYEHESTDSLFGGGSDEVWVQGVGLDSALVTVGPDRRPNPETRTSPIIGDISDDAVREGWRNWPHVLLDFDLRRPSDWPRSFTTTLLLVEEDSQTVADSFAMLEKVAGNEIKTAATTAAGALAGAAIGSVIPGIGTAVGAGVGAIAGSVYDEVIGQIKRGLDNDAFTPITRQLVLPDPTTVRSHAGIDRPQKIQVEQHGARYEIEYDWHLVE